MLINLDQQLFSFLLEHRTNLGTLIFSVFSFGGNWPVVMFLMVAVIIFLFFRKKFIFIGPLIFSVVGSGLVTALAKLSFVRPRPALSVFGEQGFSFPSGHATVAVALYAYLAFLYWGRRKKLIYIITIFIILAIGFSRLYLGAHYLSDVLAGYAVGLLFFVVAVVGTKKLVKR